MDWNFPSIRLLFIIPILSFAESPLRGRVQQDRTCIITYQSRPPHEDAGIQRHLVGFEFGFLLAS
jgi:hypothetical protein